MKSSSPLSASLLAVTLIALGVSAIRPFDYVTWLLEVAPVLIGVPLLIATRRTFPLTPLLMVWLCLHALVLILGGHYTYARVPPGDWVKEWLNLSRNHYDRLGHLFQGFVPALLAREILLRRSPLQPGKWLYFLTTCVCLAFSGCYELIEWATAVIGGEGATDFLGTQGDPWDTQQDMFMALIGALLSGGLLARWHDRQLARLAGPA
jgi:putative membrane protein